MEMPSWELSLSKFQPLNTEGAAITGLYVVGDGGTIFGGISMGEMSMMRGGAPGNMLEGKSAAGGGFGPAFLSGYCTGTYFADYIKSL